MNDLSLLEFDWKLPPGVRAAFTTRRGGASIGEWSSLNLGAHVGDDPQHVDENRKRVARLLGMKAEPGWLHQVHGVAVCDLDHVKHRRMPATADAAPVGAASCTFSVVLAGIGLLNRPTIFLLPERLPIE